MQNLALGFGGYRAVVNCNFPKQTSKQSCTQQYTHNRDESILDSRKQTADLSARMVFGFQTSQGLDISELTRQGTESLLYFFNIHKYYFVYLLSNSRKVGYSVFSKSLTHLKKHYTRITSHNKIITGNMFLRSLLVLSLIIYTIDAGMLMGSAGRKLGLNRNRGG